MSADDASAENAPADNASAARRFLLTLAYDGSRYFGWQRQPDHPTVQEAVEAAVRGVTGDATIAALASSRTDTGVHALGQSAAFTTRHWPAAADRLPFALNTRLPRDVVARRAIEVPLVLHPLRDSIGKRYRYRIYASRIEDPLDARRHWWVRRRVDPERMGAAAALMVGRHDFAALQSAGSPRECTIRELRELDVQVTPHQDGQLITVEVAANGFLYNMVRNIVGTLVQVGVGRESPEWVRRVLDSRDRRLAGPTAPAHGLCLVEVQYDPAALDRGFSHGGTGR